MCILLHRIRLGFTLVLLDFRCDRRVSVRIPDLLTHVYYSLRPGNSVTQTTLTCHGYVLRSRSLNLGPETFTSFLFVNRPNFKELIIII